MAYAETLLAAGERTVRRAHQHWFILVWRARWAILAILIALAMLILRAGTSGSSPALTALSYITFIMFAVGLASLAWGWFRFQNEEYLITSRRIIHAQGVINKKATDSSLEKINDAILTESLFGRIFGFGDLDVLTASEAGIERLRMLRDAKSFKKAMIEAKHELELELMRPTSPPLRSAAEDALPGAESRSGDAMPVPEAGTPPTDRPSPVVAALPPAATRTMMTADEFAASMERLGDLRDRGLITPADFDAKKRDLLARL